MSKESYMSPDNLFNTLIIFHRNIFFFHFGEIQTSFYPTISKKWPNWIYWNIVSLAKLAHLAYYNNYNYNTDFP